MEPNNGIRAALGFHREQIEKLWENKASKEALNNAVSDISELRADVHKIRELMEKRDTDARAERTANIKWLIGTALVAVGLVLTGMALILPYLVQ